MIPRHLQILAFKSMRETNFDIDAFADEHQIDFFDLLDWLGLDITNKRLAAYMHGYEKQAELFSAKYRLNALAQLVNQISLDESEITIDQRRRSCAEILKFKPRHYRPAQDGKNSATAKQTQHDAPNDDLQKHEDYKDDMINTLMEYLAECHDNGDNLECNPSKIDLVKLIRHLKNCCDKNRNQKGNSIGSSAITSDSISHRKSSHRETHHHSNTSAIPSSSPVAQPAVNERRKINKPLPTLSSGQAEAEGKHYSEHSQQHSTLSSNQESKSKYSAARCSNLHECTSTCFTSSQIRDS